MSEPIPEVPRLPSGLVAWSADGSAGLRDALGALGDEWSLQIVRSVHEGVERFGRLRDELGISDAVLSARLKDLTGRGMLRAAPYSEAPLRHAYALTAVSSDLWKTLVALWLWDRDWAEPGAHSAGVRIVHEGCGQATSPVYGCAACGATGVTARDTGTVMDRWISRDIFDARPRRGVRGSEEIGREAVGVLGDAWATLLLSAAMVGVRRFGDFSAALPGISPVTLSGRLEQLVGTGMLRRAPVAAGGRRQEYRLTLKSKDFFPVFAHVNTWASRHFAPDAGRTGLSIVHHACGKELRPKYTCNVCNAELVRDEVGFVAR